MERRLTVYIDAFKKENEYCITIVDHESGCEMSTSYQPYPCEDKENLYRKLGEEIYSWVDISMERDEESEDDEEC